MAAGWLGKEMAAAFGEGLPRVAGLGKPAQDSIQISLQLLLLLLCTSCLLQEGCRVDQKPTALLEACLLSSDTADAACRPTQDLEVPERFYRVYRGWSVSSLPLSGNRADTACSPIQNLGGPRVSPQAAA